MLILKHVGLILRIRALSRPITVMAKHLKPRTFCITPVRPEMQVSSSWTTCTISKKIVRWEIWKQPPPPAAPANPPYVLEQSSDKGIKMVARRPIAMGELIALERPLVVSRTDVAIAEDQSTTGIFYRAALSGLSPAARNTIKSLRNSFGPEQEPILGTLLTNYQPVTIPDADTEYSGLFPTLCRANHACSPNANFFFNSRSFTGQFHAVRAIATGEEITALYCELAASRQERRAELQEHYKFLCECPTCSLPADLVAQSDSRRRAIGKLIPMMHAGAYADDLTVARIEELLGWATDEGLYALYAEILVYGFGLATKLGASNQARKWSQLAATAFKVLDGADSPRLN
ncbi:SET domain-containing protein 5 [Mycena venus]|uniref:SET domain-containing protein 5 n=1 Tax=Mycena venus TaxID=2733690 RepID=A0A8H7D7W4_9AGAR|nr:SET domain-containing protein 5 [Mycena venus]